MRAIDLNADVGEGAATDAAIIACVTSANICCGAYAGDERTLTAAVEAAIRHGVAIGAHPGHADRAHLGRRPIALSPAEAADLVASQVGQLESIVATLGGVVAYIKPHGALYHQLAADRSLADAVAERLAAWPRPLAVVGSPRSALVEAAGAAGLTAIREGFADRAYLADGSLASRATDGAVLRDPETAAAQAVALALGEPIRTLDGGVWRAECDTLCVHGDTPGAGAIARAARAALKAAGFRLEAFGGSPGG
ncbi:MAG: 5-oxoprolinase subunit PxpA [Planctomycetota bacterium]